MITSRKYYNGHIQSMNTHKQIITAAFLAAAPIAHGAITWAAGAPGGTSGGSLNFDADAATGLFLDTGIAATAVGGVRPVASSGDYTISMWINSGRTGENWFFGTGFRGLHLGIRTTANGGTQDTLSQGHWGADSDGTTTIQPGTWYHATFTYDADGGTGGTTGLQSIYLDGALQSSTDNIGPNDATTNLIIGARNNGANTPFLGQLDDVAIWDSVVTAADINAIAGGTSPTDFGAQAYWDFEDAQTSTTAAVSGAGGLGATDLSGITVVPEPSSLALVLAGALGFMRRKRA